MLARRSHGRPHPSRYVWRVQLWCCQTDATNVGSVITFAIRDRPVKQLMELPVMLAVERRTGSPSTLRHEQQSVQHQNNPAPVFALLQVVRSVKLRCLCCLSQSEPMQSSMQVLRIKKVQKVTSISLRHLHLPLRSHSMHRIPNQSL